jgi:hypothetical protein
VFAIFLGVVASGIGLAAVNHVRENANRVHCANNLRALILATHKFHATNATLPPYWGAYPSEDSLSIKGSWFCHLLPYVGESDFYAEVTADIQGTGTNWDIEPPLRSTDGRTTVRAPVLIDLASDTFEEVARYNGHSHWVRPSADDAAHASTEVASVSATSAANGPGGVFRPQFSQRSFRQLRCPSDPSPGSYADAGDSRVYLTRPQVWGSTNYLANWNAFSDGERAKGYRAPPQSFAAISDGLANTVLFSEGYAWCDGKGRLALNSWDYHSFGLTWSLGDAVVDDGYGQKMVDYPNGMPNTYLFQVRPLPKEAPDCRAGEDCCNNWRSQTGHAVLNAGMADGSVRELGRGTSQRVWDHALLPRDGVLPGWEW